MQLDLIAFRLLKQFIIFTIDWTDTMMRYTLNYEWVFSIFLY